LKNRSFSIWLDFIERSYLNRGFKELLDKGDVSGATSNPTIFANAIKNSKALYQGNLKEVYQTFFFPKGGNYWRASWPGGLVLKPRLAKNFSREPNFLIGFRKGPLGLGTLFGFPT